METIKQASKFLVGLRKHKLKRRFNEIIEGNIYGWNASNLFLGEVIQEAIIEAYKLGKQSLSKTQANPEDLSANKDFKAQSVSPKVCLCKCHLELLLENCEMCRFLHEEEKVKPS